MSPDFIWEQSLFDDGLLDHRHNPRVMVLPPRYYRAMVLLRPLNNRVMARVMAVN